VNQNETVKNAPTYGTQDFSQRKLSCLPQKVTQQKTQQILFLKYVFILTMQKITMAELIEEHLKIEKLAEVLT
jgi:hypothetical protein